jgi:hypothetical protein
MVISSFRFVLIEQHKCLIRISIIELKSQLSKSQSCSFTVPDNREESVKFNVLKLFNNTGIFEVLNSIDVTEFLRKASAEAG